MNYKLKGRNIAAMSFGPSADTWDSLPAWQDERWMALFSCLSVHTAAHLPIRGTEGRDTRGVAQQGQGHKSSHGNLGTPCTQDSLSRGSVGSSGFSLLCLHLSWPRQSGEISQPITPTHLCSPPRAQAERSPSRGDCDHAAPAQALEMSRRCKPVLS